MTRGIRYVLMDPSKNMTLLVEDPVPAEERAAAAAALMRLEPAAEQAGFLVSPEGCDISLVMAGGEFCGNAAMSAAVLHGIRSGMTRGQVLVKISGAPKILPVEIRALSGGLWKGRVEMPSPLAAEEILFPEGKKLPVVRFQGISHVIWEEEMPAKEEAERLVRKWCRILSADALGLLFLDRETSRLTPLVYVPAAGTLFWESACASGSSAAGAWLAAEKDSSVRLALQQPGGTLEIEASPGGPLYLTGTVRCVYEKTVDPISRRAGHAR